MESVLRKFGIKKVDPKENDARIKLQKDLFHFQKGSDHGYPMKSSSISYSVSLDMVAIGTRDGYLKIYGASGQHISCQHPAEEAIQEVFFIGETLKLVTYSEDNSLQLWKVLLGQLKCQANLQLESKINHPSSFRVSNNHKHLIIGAENGNLYFVSLDDLKISPNSIFKENVLKNYFEEDSSNPGKVVSVDQLNANNLLIGYEHGLIALHNQKTKTSLCFYKAPQSLQSLHVHSSGKEFVSCHANGSYSTWILNNNNNSCDNDSNNNNNSNNNKGVCTTPYGPFPCKPIKKIVWLQCNTPSATHSSGERKEIKGSTAAINTTLQNTLSPTHDRMPTGSNGDLNVIKVPVRVNGELKGVMTAMDSNVNSSLKSNKNNSDANSYRDKNTHTKDINNSSLTNAISKSEKTTEETGNKANSTKDMFIFSGGMPRSSYADKQTVTVIQGKKHVAFDVSSKILDFVVVNKKGCRSDGGGSEGGGSDGEVGGEVGGEEDVLALLILAEQEFIAIDLLTPNWPCYKLPYMATLHSSAITCIHVIEGVDDDILLTLENAGESVCGGGVGNLGHQEFSQKPWPIQGNFKRHDKTTLLEPTNHALLITGHEDGSVKMWKVTSASEVAMVTQYHTAKLFESSAYEGEGEEEGGGFGWPPFRKTGTYDPYSDDPRLAVRKVEFCAKSGYLVSAGTAGQVVVSKLMERDPDVIGSGSVEVGNSYITKKEDKNKKSDTKEVDDRWLKVVRLSLIDERTRHFVWKGHEVMAVSKGACVQNSAFRPVCIVQTYPPVAPTALALSSEWALLAVGTAYGFGVVDYEQRKLVEIKSTLNPADLTGVHDAGMSRRKSFKKSLRESFRRLRSRRSQRNKKNIETSMKKANTTSQSPTTIEIDAPKPIERAVEARSADDVSASIVRSLYFAETYLISPTSMTASFWAGTNAGMVYIYQLVVPDPSLRNEEEVISSLAKEVHLRHHAPVVSINVVDRNGFPVQSASQKRSHDIVPANHAVVICSEEQIKLFSLPSLSAKEKYKLTAHEGAKIRKTIFAKFSSKSDSDYSETCLVCTTNLGETHVYSIPLLRRQLKVESIKKDNILGMVSCILTSQGSAYFSKSPSEVSMFTLSAHCSAHHSI